MIIRYALLFLSISVVLFFVGCGTTAIDMNAKTEFPKGRSLYVSKCNGCHQLFPKQKFDPVQWGAMLNKMQKRAAITDIEKEQIFLFLTEKTNDVSTN